MPEALTAILILNAVQVGLLCYLVAQARLHWRHINNVAEHLLQRQRREAEAAFRASPVVRVIP